MNSTHPSISRRAILRGAGATLALPWLPSFAWSHDGRNLPMILAGHGGGTIAGGRVVDTSTQSEEQQRACNLYLALTQRMGVKQDKFGDSVEAMQGLA